MVPHLWVKLHTSAELKTIRIAMPTVLGELWFVHTTSVSSGNGWIGVSYIGKCPAAVPCATADEESGSSLKPRSCLDQHHVLLKNWFWKYFLSNEPLHKI